MSFFMFMRTSWELYEEVFHEGEKKIKKVYSKRYVYNGNGCRDDDR